MSCKTVVVSAPNPIALADSIMTADGKHAGAKVLASLTVVSAAVFLDNSNARHNVVITQTTVNSATLVALLFADHTL